MKRLIDELVVKKLGNPVLNKLHDSAFLNLERKRIAFTTDSYVIKPIFFNGGDIGKLAVYGTVNDLAVSGARPLYLSLSFIIEEGFPISDLGRIIDSIKLASEEADVLIATGDTKVVEKTSADGIFINTSGVGIIEEGIDFSQTRVRAGDKIIVNGYIGEHGISVLSLREGIKFETPIKSDVAPLSSLILGVLKRHPEGQAYRASKEIHFMRDPTRGGVAMTLNEIATPFNLGIEIYEKEIPIREEVQSACDMLGLDVLSVANEGKVIIVASPEVSDAILKDLKSHPLGNNAKIIGEVVEQHRGTVVLNTAIGGTRIVDMPYGEELPRIC